MKARNHKIRTSAPKSAEQRRKEEAAAARRAALERWAGSEEKPEQHALRLDLPAGVYRCRVCGHIGEARRRAGLRDAYFGSQRWCGGMRSVIELCHADLGQHGELVRDESGGE